MKRYFALIICLIMTANLYCQEKYPVPTRTCEQKFNWSNWVGWLWMGYSAKIAKEDGENLYESGRRMGQLVAPTWGKQEANLDALVKGWVGNCVNFQRAKDSAPEVKENPDGSVSVIADDNSIHDFFMEGGSISYDEFLEYWKGIFDVVADYKGATILIDHQDSLMVYTFRKK